MSGRTRPIDARAVLGAPPQSEDSTDFVRLGRLATLLGIVLRAGTAGSVLIDWVARMRQPAVQDILLYREGVLERLVDVLEEGFLGTTGPEGG